MYFFFKIIIEPNFKINEYFKIKAFELGYFQFKKLPISGFLNTSICHGLEMIATKYMPWLFGKTPCTYITHILRFFGFLTNINVGYLGDLSLNLCFYFYFIEP
jgi:hypothetical protein